MSTALNEAPAPGFLAGLRRIAGALVELEIWVVTLVVAASFVQLRLLPAAAIAAVVFWPLRLVAHGRLTRRSPADAGVVVLLVMCAVTLWATALPDKTLPQVYRLLSGMGLFYAILNWADRPGRLRLLLAGVALAGSGLALFAAVSVEWPVGKLPFLSGHLYERFLTLVADTVHPNVLAGSLVILFPVPLAALLFGWRRIGWGERLFYALAVLVMLAATGLTQSRGGWMAAGVVFLALALLGIRKGWLILGPGAVLAGVVVGQQGAARLLELVFSSGAIRGWDGRREIWSRAVFMIQDFPFTGVGMGSFMDVADAMYPFLSYQPGSIDHAHNLFLQVAVDLGLPGLAGWLVVLLAGVWMAWKAFRYGRTHKDGLAAALGAGLLASQAALVVHGMTDAVTWGMVRPAPFVWALWGLAAAGWWVWGRGEAQDAAAEG